CDNNVEFWHTAEKLFASLLVPGLASANAVTTLNKQGCWLAKQTNATSAALSSLLIDVDSVRQVRHATLQNRAAIDFLLVAHRHGREDFDGLCCINLSDHSESIHKKINELHKLVGKLNEDEEWNILGEWFSGMGRWVKKYLMLGLFCSVVFVCIL
ncbi:hypothetical protein N338_02989, partial [Podiceps cristatus]